MRAKGNMYLASLTLFIVFYPPSETDSMMLDRCKNAIFVVSDNIKLVDMIYKILQLMFD